MSLDSNFIKINQLGLKLPWKVQPASLSRSLKIELHKSNQNDKKTSKRVYKNVEKLVLIFKVT